MIIPYIIMALLCVAIFGVWLLCFWKIKADEVDKNVCFIRSLGLKEIDHFLKAPLILRFIRIHQHLLEWLIVNLDWK